MKEFAILRFLDKVSFLFEKNEIDYPIMRRILQIKFVMDERRVPTVMMNGKNKTGKNSFRGALMVYGFMGLIIGLFLFPAFPLFYKMNIIIGMILFMIMTSMVSDFSSVLLDVADKSILLPRPVDTKTLNAAKIIHIIVYLFSLTIAIAGSSLIIGLIRYGFLFSLILFLEIILVCCFAILFTALFYYAVLAIFSGEKLKDIINYFQIALVIMMTIMYQLIGRIFDISNLNLSVTPHLWDFLLPSAWFSAPFLLFMEKDYSRHYVLLSCIGVIVPLITIILYVKVVAPRFEKKLQKLNSSGSLNKNRLGKKSLQRAVSNLICAHPIEKAFFRFTLQMLNNERKLKLRLYPNLVFAVLFPFIFFLTLFTGEASFSDTFAQLSHGRYYLYLYFSVAFLASCVSMMSLSENYKGAWIYKALPVDHPAMIIKGAFKGFLYQYTLPVYLFISVLFIGIFGLKIIPDLVLIFLNLFFLMLAILKSSKKELPFSNDYQYKQTTNNTVIMVFSFGLCGVCALIHYLASVFIPFGVVINIGISLVIGIVLWHCSFKITWKEIMEVND